jgi:hypothetical protein
MSKDSATKNGGISAIGLLGVAFVILKLCHVIDWSWWWVTAPFWGGLAIYIVVLAIALIVWIVKELWNK